MQTEPSLRLVTRRTKNNPNHHLWNNHGTWWLHFTLHSTTGTKKRHRISLKTGELETARRRRNGILNDLQSNSGHIAA